MRWTVSITSNGNETRNNDAVLRLTQFISKLQPGTIIEHSQVAEITSIENKRTRYQIVSRAKRELIRTSGIFLDAVHNVGYKVLTPGSEINSCVSRTVKAFRQEIRAAHDAMCIRTDKIEDKAARDRTESLTSQLTARLPFTDNQMRLLENIVTGGVS